MGRHQSTVGVSQLSLLYKDKTVFLTLNCYIFSLKCGPTQAMDKERQQILQLFEEDSNEECNVVMTLKMPDCAEHSIDPPQAHHISQHDSL